ncbi:hypothetical protein RJ641_020810 [Dillenia turbinata]|uniref:Uncharacterized protein n=1 Tax=Dillenia turbinata TaxID=194707 RepID=A0AAN8YZY2_9MAGN
MSWSWRWSSPVLDLVTSYFMPDRSNSRAQRSSSSWGFFGGWPAAATGFFSFSYLRNFSVVDNLLWPKNKENYIRPVVPLLNPENFPAQSIKLQQTGNAFRRGVEDIHSWLLGVGKVGKTIIIVVAPFVRVDDLRNPETLHEEFALFYNGVKRARFGYPIVQVKSEDLSLFP